MPDNLPNDCFAPNSALMRHDEALALLKGRISPSVDACSVPLIDTVGRVLAERVVAAHPVPMHANAAVDGYAFAFADYDGKSGVELPVVGRAAAGHPFKAATPKGSTVRILTGAVLPEGLDTVAMQEDVTISDDEKGQRASLPGGLKAGANVRQAGEDVGKETELLSAGHILRPQDLAALASVGCGTVSCFRPLRVGIVSSGDEVIRAGSRPLEVGEVYDANAPMLVALVRLAGAKAVDLGIWPDERDEVVRRLAESAKVLDVILTSGGASQSEEDHMSEALGRLGSRHFWRIAVKPGRPMMFGQIGRATMIGLPGNPVAVFVCFLMYVFPLLRRLSGAYWPEPRRFLLPAAFAFPKRKLGRREYWRASLIEGPQGTMVEKFARDGSGLISGLRAADGLIEVGEDVAAIGLGDLVAYIPFSEFGILGR
jgi:molybdopterin molybdotransferase